VARHRISGDPRSRNAGWRLSVDPGHHRGTRPGRRRAATRVHPRHIPSNTGCRATKAARLSRAAEDEPAATAGQRLEGVEATAIRGREMLDFNDAPLQDTGGYDLNDLDEPLIRPQAWQQSPELLSRG